MSDNPYSQREVFTPQTNRPPLWRYIVMVVFVLLGILNLLLACLAIYAEIGFRYNDIATKTLNEAILLIAFIAAPGFAWIYAGIAVIRGKLLRGFILAIAALCAFVLLLLVG